MGGKRGRKAANHPKDKNQGNVSTADNADTAAGRSRLKKPRTREDAKPSSEHLLGRDRKSRDDEFNQSVAELRGRIDAYLSAAVESKYSKLPDVGLITAIQHLLLSFPAPAVLKKLNTIPRVLLIALRKGMQTLDQPLTFCSEALIRSLIVLAMGADLEIPDSARGAVALRSAFQTTRPDHFTLNEMEAMGKAGSWAAHVLTDGVRGKGLQHCRKSNQVESSRVEHHDISSVFVSSRHLLDQVMSRCYVSEVSQLIAVVMRHQGLSASAKSRLLQSILAKLRHVSSPGELIDVLEASVFGLVRTSEGRGVDCMKVLHEKVRNDLMTCIHSNSKGSGRVQMSLGARAAAMFSSSETWNAHAQAVKLWFREKHGYIAKDEDHAVQVLAMGAVEHVDRHWELMDTVRRELSSKQEPFSVRLWLDYRFYREVLSAVNAAIATSLGDGHAHGELQSPCTPLCMRFPVRFRPLVRAMAVFTCRSGYKPSSSVKGLHGLAMVHDMLGLAKSLNISPNVHACMICCESLLEELCWFSGRWAAGGDRQVGATGACLGRGKLCLTMSDIIAAQEQIRLPGGDWAEPDAVVRRRASAVCAALMWMCQKRQFPTDRRDEWRVNGLLAWSLCGIISEEKLQGLSRFLKMLERFEAVELLRASERCLGLVLDHHESRGRVMELSSQLRGLLSTPSDVGIE